MFSASTVASATSIAVLSFLGFDGISTLAEESRGNQYAIGRATVLSLAIGGLVHAADLDRHRSGARHAFLPDTAFYEVAQRRGAWLRC